MTYPSLLLVIVLSFSACSKPGATSEALQGRLAAALAVDSPDSRNALLSALALEAANAKDLPITIKAIESLQSPDRWDQTADACARALHQQGDFKGATAVAQLIRSPSLREKAMTAIAQGR